MNRFGTIFFLLIISAALHAQVLTLDEAVNVALRNSLDIQIARNAERASAINNHPSVAGALPEVTASASDNQSLTNLNQQLSSGSNIKRSGNTNNSINAGITGNFLVFNGFRV